MFNSSASWCPKKDSLSLFISLDKEKQIQFEEYPTTKNNEEAEDLDLNDEEEEYWYYDALNEYEYEFYDLCDHDYDYAMFEEEKYHGFVCAAKGGRGFRAKIEKVKHWNKSKRKQMKACVERKKIERLEEVAAQLIARKQRSQERCRIEQERNYLGHGNETSISLQSKAKGKSKRKSNSHPRVGLGYQGVQTNKPISSKNYYGHDYHGGSDAFVPHEQVLSAQDLGIETGAMYDRLIEIMNGGNITPEDFDLLLQLDEGNQRSTLDKEVIKEFDVITVGKGLKSEVVDINGRCLICLDPFQDMSTDSDLKRLPCGHFFCKGCIDAWLSNMSSKCPDLSCYWRNGASDLSEPYQSVSSVVEEVGNNVPLPAGVL